MVMFNGVDIEGGKMTYDSQEKRIRKDMAKEIYEALTRMGTREDRPAGEIVIFEYKDFKKAMNFFAGVKK